MKNKNSLYASLCSFIFLVGSFGSIICSESSALLNKNTFYGAYKNFIPNQFIFTGDQQNQRFFSVQPTTHSLLQQFGECNKFKSVVFKQEQLAPFKAGGYGLFQEINKGNMTSSLTKPDNKAENKSDSVDFQKDLSDAELVKEIAQGGIKNTVLSEEISAKTVAGRAFLLDMLSHPITDVAEIEKRRKTIKKLRAIKLRNRNTFQLECVDLEAGCSLKTQELREFYDQQWVSPSQFTGSKWLSYLVGMRVLRSLYTNHEGPINDLNSDGMRNLMGGLSAGVDMPLNVSWLEGIRFFYSSLMLSSKNHATTVVESVLNAYGVNGWSLLAKGHWLAGGVFTAMPLINWFFCNITMSDAAKEDLVKIPVRAGAGTPNTMIMTGMDGYRFTKLGESEQFICDYLEKMFYAKTLWENIAETLDVPENEKQSISAFFNELELIYNKEWDPEPGSKIKLYAKRIYNKISWLRLSQKLVQFFWKTVNKPLDQNPLQQFWVLLGKYDAYLAIASYFDRLAAKGLSICEVEFDEKSNDPCIEIKGAYHPLIAVRNGYKNIKTSDITFNKDTRNIQLVAPNMAGKSVFLSTLLQEIDLAQSTGFMCATSAKMTPVRVRASKNVDESMASQKSTGRAQVNSIGELVEEIKIATKDNSKILLLVDEPCAGLKEAGAQKILFAKDGLIETCDKNPQVMCCMVTHFDLRENLKKFKSFKYKNLSVKEEKEADTFEYTYALENGEGWWFSDPEKRRRFVGWFTNMLKKQTREKVRNKVVNYPEFETVSFEDLPTLIPGDSTIARFMHKFNRTTVTPLEQLQKLNVIGEEKSLFHAIAGEKRERLQTSIGALKLSQWLVSPGTTKEEIVRRQKLVEELRGKKNSERRKEVQKTCAEFKQVEHVLAGDAVRIASQSSLYKDGTFKAFKWKVDIKEYLSERSSITVLRTVASLKGMGAYILTPIISSALFNTLLNSFFSIERFIDAWKNKRPLQFLQEAKTWKTAMFESMTPKSPFGKSTFNQFMNQVTGIRAIKALYNKDYKTGVFSLCSFIGTCGLTYFIYKNAQKEYANSDYGRGDELFLPYFDAIQKGRTLLNTAAQQFGNSVQLSLDKKFEKIVDTAQKSLLPSGKIECLVDYCGYKLKEKCKTVATDYKSTLPLHDLFDQMGELDAACAIAEWLDMLEEKGFSACKASFIEDKDVVGAQVTMQGAIHPLFPFYSNYVPNNVVRNDFKFDENKRDYMITAPNSSGKSVAIQNAFNINIAQSFGWALCQNYKAAIFHKVIFNKSINDDMSKGDSTGSAQAGSVLDLADMVEWAGENEKNVFLGCDELLSGTQESLAKDLLFNTEVLGLFKKMNTCPYVISMLSTHFDLHEDIQTLKSFCSKYMVVVPHKNEKDNTYTFEKTFKLADETDHSVDDVTQGNWWINPEKRFLVEAYMNNYYEICLNK